MDRCKTIHYALINQIYPVFFLFILSCWQCIQAQPSKGSLVVEPQLMVTNFNFSSTDNLSLFIFGVNTSLRYYITDRLSVGVWVPFNYLLSKALVTSVYTRRVWGLNVSPEIQYDIPINQRFTVFLGVEPYRIGYSNQFHDNPQIPVAQRRIGYFVTEKFPISMGLYGGVAYSFTERIALFASLNENSLATPIRNKTNAGIVCQITLQAHL